MGVIVLELNFVASEVEYLMHQAGWAWLRLRVGAGCVGVQIMNWEVAEDPATAYGYTDVEVRRSVPTSREIWLMDEANRWLGYISDPVARRVVALRMMYDDDRGRCLNSYTKCGKIVRTSVHRVRKMHWRGLDRIAAELNKNNRLKSKIVLYLPDMEGVEGVRMDFSREAGQSASH